MRRFIVTIIVEKNELLKYESLKKKLLYTYRLILAIAFILMGVFFIVSNQNNKSVFLIVNIFLTMIISIITIYFMKHLYPRIKQIIRFLRKVNNDEYEICDITFVNHIGMIVKEDLLLDAFTASSLFKNTLIEKTVYTLNHQLPIESNTKIRIWHINNIIIAYEVLYETGE